MKRDLSLKTQLSTYLQSSQHQEQRQMVRCFITKYQATPIKYTYLKKDFPTQKKDSLNTIKIQQIRDHSNDAYLSSIEEKRLEKAIVTLVLGLSKQQEVGTDIEIEDLVEKIRALHKYHMNKLYLQPSLAKKSFAANVVTVFYKKIDHPNNILQLDKFLSDIM